MQLRDYQIESVEAAWSSARAGNSPLIILPTGSGKSLVIAEMLRVAVTEWGGRAIVLAHRKELLEQNSKELQNLLPDIDCGIYSAGLNSRDIDHDIIFAGIQSAYTKALDFGERHIVVIDEAHLFGPKQDGMYTTFLRELRNANPWLKTFGLTATPYRTGSGCLTNSGIFTEICYSADIIKLIDDGYLCTVTNRPADNQVDTSKLQVRQGEFVVKQMEDLFSVDVNGMIADEILEKCTDRHSIMVFCPSVAHAEAIQQLLIEKSGERVEMIDANTHALFRQSYIDDFKRQKYRFLVNCGVLTTGFNAPCVDAVAVVRATASAGLFAQIVGRGMRVHESKPNGCMILDFGENLRRHGPINSKDYGKVSDGDREPGEAPTRICPQCEEHNPIQYRSCVKCGFQFPEPEVKDKLTEADTISPVIEEVVPVEYDVEECVLSKHTKRGALISSLRIDYKVIGAIQPFSEWVCLEHDGFARSKGERTWKLHTDAPCPFEVDEALDLWKRLALRMPSKITVKPDGGFFRIVHKEFDCDIPDGWEDSDELTYAEDFDENEPHDVFQYSEDDIPF